MAIKINREKRNTIAAFLLFIYGCILIPAMLVRFEHEAYEINLISALILTSLLSLINSMIFYNVRLSLRFPFRLLFYWMLLTGVNLLIWLYLFNGTFILKD